VSFFLWLSRNGYVQHLPTWGYLSLAKNLLNHKHSENLALLFGSLLIVFLFHCELKTASALSDFYLGEGEGPWSAIKERETAWYLLI